MSEDRRSRYRTFNIVAWLHFLGVLGQAFKGLFVWAFGSVLAQGYENMAVQAV